MCSRKVYQQTRKCFVAMYCTRSLMDTATALKYHLVTSIQNYHSGHVAQLFDRNAYYMCHSAFMSISGIQ